MKQEFTSKNTTSNYNRVPALFKKINWVCGTINLDIGGGPYDTATDYLKDFGVSNLIYDPYNRSEDHNLMVKSIISSNKPHTSTLSNVLCVIKEKEVRIELLNFAKDNSNILFVSVYPGSGTVIGKITKKDCWQENRKLNSYLEEVSQIFLYVVMKRNLIISWNHDIIQIDELIRKQKVK